LSLEALLTLPVLLLAALLCAGLIRTAQAALVLDYALAAACRDLADSSYLLRQAEGLGMSFLSSSSSGGGLSGDLSEGLSGGLSGDLSGDLGVDLGGGLSEEWLAGEAGDGLRELLGAARARACLASHLTLDPAIAGAITWEKARLPAGWHEDKAAEDAGGIWSELGQALNGWLASPSGEGQEEAAAALWTAGEDDDVLLAVRLTPARLDGLTALLPESWTLTFIKRQKAWLIGRNILPERGLEQAAGQKEKGALVYITRWGTRYHRDDCRYLAKSKIPAYLNRLAGVYLPCQICRPPARQE
jgi:hypothetical protein